MSAQESNERFAGLCFPTVRVRYAGPTNTRGSRWIASLTRGNDKFRVSLPYASELPSGSTQAVRAARACLQKAMDRYQGIADNYVAVPGELDADTYVFVFVPADYIGNAS